MKYQKKIQLRMDNDFATENTYWRGSITVQPTSCLFCLELAALFKLNDKQTGGHLYSDTSSSVSVLCLVYFPSMTRRHFCIIMILMKKFFSSGTCLSWIQFNFCSSDLQRNKVRLSLWENTSKQKKKFHYLKLTFCCHYYYKIWNESLMYVTGHSAFVTVLIKTWLN